MRSHPFTAAAAAAAGLVAGIAITPPPAAAAVVLSTQVSASSYGDFVHAGTPFSGRDDSVGTGRAESQQLLGNLSTPVVRTAGRVSHDELAVNTRIDGKDLFTFTPFEASGSDVRYTADVMPVASNGERVYATFHLPGGYVETMHNAELRFSEIRADLQATIDLRFCNAGGCRDEQAFIFQASLESSFVDESHGVHARGQPGLDVSPLLDVDWSDSGVGFLRTRQLAFDDFTGTIDLGVLSIGDTVTFEYTLLARAEGEVGFSYGIGAINDPFFFSGDAVRRHPVVSFVGVAVDPAALPQPPGTALVVAAMAALLGTRRRRSAG